MAAPANTSSPVSIGSEYAAIGVPLSSFLLFPSVTVTTTFDDNIKRTPTNNLTDTFFTFSPSVALRSQWARHALNVTASSDSLVYAKYSTENVTLYNFNADGRIDVFSSLRLTGLITFGQLYEFRASPELPTDAMKPLPYKRTRGDVSLEYQPAQLGVEIGLGFDRYRYGSVDTPSGQISWADLNRDVISPHARAFYEFQSGYAAYIETIFEQRDFELDVDRSGLDRSSHGYRVRGGVEASLSNLIVGEVFVGYLDQQYPSPLEDVRGLDFGATLDWFITPLTTFHLLASRTVNDTTFVGVSGIDDQTIALSIDHGLLRNLILRGNIGYTDSQFRGGSRNDQVTDAGVGGQYLLNRYLSVAVRYAYQRRTSDVAGQGYTDNLFSIAVRGQL